MTNEQSKKYTAMSIAHEILINQGGKNIPSTNNKYLDARYWDIVFEGYENFGTLDVDVKDDNYSVTNNININNENIPIIIKLRIMMSNHNLYNSDNLIENIVHNNVIIIDAERKQVIRYEPCHENKLNHFINTQITSLLVDDSYEYMVIYDDNCMDEYCVAHSMRFSLDYIYGFDSENIPIEKFVDSVEYFIGELKGEPVIETGNGFLGGAVIGGLAGGLVGGALIGGAIGGISDGFGNHRGYERGYERGYNRGYYDRYDRRYYNGYYGWY